RKGVRREPCLRLDVPAVLRDGALDCREVTAKRTSLRLLGRLRQIHLLALAQVKLKCRIELHLLVDSLQLQGRVGACAFELAWHEPNRAARDAKVRYFPDQRAEGEVERR